MALRLAHFLKTSLIYSMALLVSPVLAKLTLIRLGLNLMKWQMHSSASISSLHKAFSPAEVDSRSPASRMMF
jgi:hypothetical protein